MAHWNILGSIGTYTTLDYIEHRHLWNIGTVEAIDHTTYATYSTDRTLEHWNI